MYCSFLVSLACFFNICFHIVNNNYCYPYRLAQLGRYIRIRQQKERTNGRPCCREFFFLFVHFESNPSKPTTSVPTRVINGFESLGSMTVNKIILLLLLLLLSDADTIIYYNRLKKYLQYVHV